MAWTVEWSEPAEADQQEKDGTPNVFLAFHGRDEALEAASKYLEAGFTVWCIKNEMGVLEMDRNRVFHHFYPLTS